MSSVVQTSSLFNRVILDNVIKLDALYEEALEKEQYCHDNGIPEVWICNRDCDMCIFQKNTKLRKYYGIWKK